MCSKHLKVSKKCQHAAAIRAAVLLLGGVETCLISFIRPLYARGLLLFETCFKDSKSFKEMSTCFET